MFGVVVLKKNAFFLSKILVLLRLLGKIMGNKFNQDTVIMHYAPDRGDAL